MVNVCQHANSLCTDWTKVGSSVPPLPVSSGNGSLPPQVPDHRPSVAAPGRLGDGAAAALWLYRRSEGLCVLEDLHGSKSRGSGSGSRDPQQREPPPGHRQSPGQAPHRERVRSINPRRDEMFIVMLLSPAVPRSAGQECESCDPPRPISRDQPAPVGAGQPLQRFPVHPDRQTAEIGRAHV